MTPPPVSLVDYWPILLSILFGVVWLVRLEGRINQTDKDIVNRQREIEILRVKHESLDAKIVDQLAEVRESLARLEGALGIARGEPLLKGKL